MNLSIWKYRPQTMLSRILACGMVLASMLGVAQAQTKVTAAQLPNLQGAVEGPTNATTLRDLTSASDFTSGGVTGGIAGAIAACGTTQSCSIIIPPSYGLNDTVPGYRLDPNNPPAGATTPGNVTIFDQRYGDARMGVNPRGYTDGLISSPNAWVYNYYAKQQPMAYVTPLYILQNSWDGGTNGQTAALSYWDKTSYTPLTINHYSHTPGQHIGIGLTTKSYSVGDVLGFANYVYCYGGLTSEADEGCEAQDNQVFMGNVAYAGKLTGTPATGGATVSISPTQGLHTQGAGRFLIRASAGTISAGTIAGITSPGNALTSITGSGTTWPVSTMIGQLGTNVSTPGAATVTPTAFTSGAMAQITTSSLVCVADGGAFEMVTPSAVTATTFTATFRKVHPASATIATGGVCGYLLDVTADDVVDSTYPSKVQSIQGTLRFAWPAVASTSATALQLYVAGGGAYQQMVSRWDATSANGYVLYPMAEVVSVQQGGGLSDTLTLGPNNVAWTAGDSVEEPLYPAQRISFGNTTIESYYPNFGGAAGGAGYTFNGPLQGNDTMMALRNNAPASMYKSGGGKYTPPTGVHISGQTSYGMMIDTPGDQFTIGVGCATPCTAKTNILASQNATGYDYLQYDEANKRWVVTANSNASSYVFGSTLFQTPFAGVSMGSDANGVGYVTAPSFHTGTANNTDVAGELTFSGATTMTYSFAGAYNAHPECWAEPQFDAGSGNRHWITYSGLTSMTVHFATSVTGTVSYGCMGRN